MSLLDAFGRDIRYLRVSVTDRCNYRCWYCRPAQGSTEWPDEALLSDDELVRLVGLFTDLGVGRIRLTGGEPLLRRHLVDLVRRLAALPRLTDLSLSTNARLMDRYAVPLRQAGIGRVNISLDTLKPSVFAQITRGGELAAVLRGIDATLAAGFDPVKVNMVVMRGVNLDEIPDMVQFAERKGLLLRFVESMPLGVAGADRDDQFVGVEEIHALIERHFGGALASDGAPCGAGPARYYRIKSSAFRFGVISALSQHFCATCNRVRLTSRGALVLCLGQLDRVELRPLLREGVDDQAIIQAILAAVQRKPMQHDLVAVGRDQDMSSLGG